MHDARNLLAVVLGLAECALDRTPPAATPGELRLLHDAAARAAVLLGGALSGTASAVRPLRPGESLHAAAPLLRRVLGDGIALELPPGPGPLVAADPALLERVWLNLARNAARALGGGGRLSVTLEREPRPLAPGGPDVPACCVAWEDDGPGFPPAVLARLGQPLNTAAPGTSPESVPATGTGLGLSGSMALVRRMGGVLEAGNHPGGGARLRVWLPEDAAGQGTDAAPPPDSARRDAAPAGRPLLLVEDEPILRRMAARVLAAAGWTVLEADSAEAALALPAEPAPALLVTDLGLPGLDGLALAARLRQASPGLPVLLTSGYDHPGALPAGVTPFPKPFPLAALVALAGRMAGGG